MKNGAVIQRANQPALKPGAEVQNEFNKVAMKRSSELERVTTTNDLPESRAGSDTGAKFVKSKPSAKKLSLPRWQQFCSPQP